MVDRERFAVCKDHVHAFRGMLEAQLPWRADFDGQLDTFEFLQRAKQRDVGSMVETPATGQSKKKSDNDV